MRVEAAAADDVAAGRRDDGAAAARQERAGDQERRADRLGQLARDLDVRLDLGRADGDRVVLAPFDLGADVLEQVEHGVDVAYVRDVAKDDLLLGEEAGRQRGQCRVLVPGRNDRA